MEKFFEVWREEQAKFYNQMQEISTELAVTSSNFKNALEQINKQSLVQEKTNIEIDKIKENQNKAIGAIGLLKVAIGAILLLISGSWGFTFSSIVDTKTWIAKTDQWKQDIERKVIK